MGVLCDYFRAAGAAEVAKQMETTEGHSPLFSGGPAVADGVDAKGIDPAVILGQLIAMILEVEWSPGLVSGGLAWPVGELDPEYQGPWVDTVATELVGLARRAQAAGDDLYCWISL